MAKKVGIYGHKIRREGRPHLGTSITMVRITQGQLDCFATHQPTTPTELVMKMASKSMIKLLNNYNRHSNTVVLSKESVLWKLSYKL